MPSAVPFQGFGRANSDLMKKAPGYPLPGLNSQALPHSDSVEGGQGSAEANNGTSANSRGECRQPGSQEGQGGRGRSEVLKMEAHIRHISAT